MSAVPSTRRSNGWRPPYRCSRAPRQEGGALQLPPCRRLFLPLPGAGQRPALVPKAPRSSRTFDESSLLHHDRLRALPPFIGSRQSRASTSIAALFSFLVAKAIPPL